MKSITYEHALEHTFCLFESGVREANLVACAAALDFVHVISNMPECVASTKLVIPRHDIVCESHLSSSAGYGPV
jgi:hypothetical protein